MSAEAYRGLGWAHGTLAVQRLGAMLAPVTFLLDDPLPLYGSEAVMV